MGDCPQVYPDGPFKGTVRTPTALSGRRHRKARLVAPFYDRYTFPSPRDSHPVPRGALNIAENRSEVAALGKFGVLYVPEQWAGIMY